MRNEQMDRLWHFQPSNIPKKRREARVGRGRRDQERNLSSSDKKLIPSQSLLSCNTNVTEGVFARLAAPGPQTTGVHPTAGAIVRNAYGPTILLTAHPRLTQQATAACGEGAACVCFSSNGEEEKGKDSKSLQRHI